MADVWEGCYDDGWQGDIVPEAFSHPAKQKSFFRRLTESKGSPRIDYESVVCLQKPLDN